MSWPHDPACGSKIGEIGEKQTDFGNNEGSTTQCHEMRRTSESLPPSATDSFLSVESLFATSWLLDESDCHHIPHERCQKSCKIALLSTRFLPPDGSWANHSISWH
jgi:hypothetical protein